MEEKKVAEKKVKRLKDSWREKKKREGGKEGWMMEAPWLNDCSLKCHQ